MGDGRAEGSLAVGDGGRATISLMPDGTGGASWLGYIYPLIQWWLGHSSFFLIIGAQSHWLAFWMVASRKLSCPVLCSGPVPPKETVPPRMKKILLPFPVSWVSSVLQFFLLPLAALHSFARPPSFHLAPLLSIIFIFVAIVIAWHFLAVPATSLLL